MWPLRIRLPSLLRQSTPVPAEARHRVPVLLQATARAETEYVLACPVSVRFSDIGETAGEDVMNRLTHEVYEALKAPNGNMICPHS